MSLRFLIRICGAVAAFGAGVSFLHGADDPPANKFSSTNLEIKGARSVLTSVPIAAAAKHEKQAAAEAARDYVRFIGDNLRGKLETVVVTMKNAAGVTVELIGAVHIADAAYYQTLMKLFAGYEALLFELVDGQTLKESVELPPRKRRGKPLKEVPPEAAEAAREAEDAAAKASAKDDPAFAILRMMMTGMGSYLRLQYQTDGINYHTKNFVHADVSLDEFTRLQAEKGESFAKLFQKAFEAQIGRGSRKDEEPTGAQLLLALLGDSSGIKIAMARMLGKAEELGEELGFGSDSVIVGERNRVALEIFDREVKAGRKNLGIFYGAAHLADLERRLEERGYRREGERWLTAWDIKPRKEQKAGPEAKP
jgi:hypothetical protein